MPQCWKSCCGSNLSWSPNHNSSRKRSAPVSWCLNCRTIFPLFWLDSISLWASATLWKGNTRSPNHNSSRKRSAPVSWCLNCRTIFPVFWLDSISLWASATLWNGNTVSIIGFNWGVESFWNNGRALTLNESVTFFLYWNRKSIPHLSHGLYRQVWVKFKDFSRLYYSFQGLKVKKNSDLSVKTLLKNARLR